MGCESIWIVLCLFAYLVKNSARVFCWPDHTFSLFMQQYCRFLAFIKKSHLNLDIDVHGLTVWVLSSLDYFLPTFIMLLRRRKGLGTISLCVFFLLRLEGWTKKHKHISLASVSMLDTCRTLRCSNTCWTSIGHLLVQ